MKDSESLITNREQVEKWLSSSQSVVVFVNSQCKGVLAPASQLSKPSFSLSISHFFDRALVLSEEGFSAELLFDHSFSKCLIPWASIWAAYPDGLSGIVQFWNDNSPGPGWDKALSDYLNVETPVAAVKTEKPKLSLIKEQAQEQSEEAAPVPAASKLDGLKHDSEAVVASKVAKPGLSVVSAETSADSQPIKKDTKVRPQLKLIK